MDKDEDDRKYRVLVNEEEQYSLWLFDSEVPKGWKDTGVNGPKADCLKYVGEVWTDMRPKSLREHMAKHEAEHPFNPDDYKPKTKVEPPRVNDLVQRLSEGQHAVSAERYKSVSDLKGAIDNGYTLLKFTETKGGTELGVRLDKSKCQLTEADFEAGTGKVRLVGSLVLNYNEVEMDATIDLANLRGQGCLILIADEPTWRAKQMQKDAAREAHA